MEELYVDVNSILMNMHAGKPYPMSSEQREQAERIARRAEEGDEGVNIQAWAGRLADDVAGAGD